MQPALDNPSSKRAVSLEHSRPQLRRPGSDLAKPNNNSLQHQRLVSRLSSLRVAFLVPRRQLVSGHSLQPSPRLDSERRRPPRPVSAVLERLKINRLNQPLDLERRRRRLLKLADSDSARLLSNNPLLRPRSALGNNRPNNLLNSRRLDFPCLALNLRRLPPQPRGVSVSAQPQHSLGNRLGLALVRRRRLRSRLQRAGLSPLALPPRPPPLRLARPLVSPNRQHSLQLPRLDFLLAHLRSNQLPQEGFSVLPRRPLNQRAVSLAPLRPNQRRVFSAPQQLHKLPLLRSLLVNPRLRRELLSLEQLLRPRLSPLLAALARLRLKLLHLLQEVSSVRRPPHPRLACSERLRRHSLHLVRAPSSLPHRRLVAAFSGVPRPTSALEHRFLLDNNLSSLPLINIRTASILCWNRRTRRLRDHRPLRSRCLSVQQAPMGPRGLENNLVGRPRSPSSR